MRTTRSQAVLEIRVLGYLEVLRDGESIALPPSKKTRALLGYLVTTGREHRRERLCSTFWDVADDPRGGLRWSISKLRGLLDEPGVPRIAADRETVSFVTQQAQVDLLVVRDCVAPGLEHADVPALEHALRQFRGELLEELDLPDFHDYQAWLVAQREQARTLRRSLARTLTERLANEPTRAAAYARTWVELEPTRPQAWATLVRLLGQAGHEREAEAQLEMATRFFKERGLSGLDVIHEARLSLQRRSVGAVSSASSIPAAPKPSAPKPQEIRFCKTRDGVQLAYASVGQGPPLVKTGHWISHLEHEWTSPVWSHVLHELSDYRTLVRYDQRGNGMSDWDVPDLDFEHMVSDLETVVDAAGLERFALFGLSQGAAVSVAYTVRHPERVTRLVLHGGYARGWGAWNEHSVAEGNAMITLMSIGWGRENPAFRQMFTSNFIPSASLEQMRWFNELQRVSSTGDNAVRLMNALAPVDVVELLAKVRVPTLVTHARGDALAPFEQGRKLAGGIPGARFIPLASNNHLMLEHEPAWQVFRQALREFLAEDA